LGAPDAVLVTRPEPGASETAERLRRMGLRPVLARMLEIETLHPVLPDPATIQAVLIASGNAILALPASWHATKLLAVGDATAARARHAKFTNVASADGDATALTALAVARCRPDAGPLLIAAGEGRGTELAASLSDRGFTVRVAEVYAARPATALPQDAIEAIRAGFVYAALFFSAETARTFAHLVATERESLRGVLAVAIGQPVAVALRGLPWRSIRIAHRPTQDEVFACLR
jgi:uroporphyrinogen-III synthase